MLVKKKEKKMHVPGHLLQAPQQICNLRIPPGAWSWVCLYGTQKVLCKLLMRLTQYPRPTLPRDSGDLPWDLVLYFVTSKVQPQVLPWIVATFFCLFLVNPWVGRTPITPGVGRTPITPGTLVRGIPCLGI